MVISMDADLQDDVDAADAMVDKYLDGVDIVYGTNRTRLPGPIFPAAISLRSLSPRRRRRAICIFRNPCLQAGRRPFWDWGLALLLLLVPYYIFSPVLYR